MCSTVQYSTYSKYIEKKLPSPPIELYACVCECLAQQTMPAPLTSFPSISAASVYLCAGCIMIMSD